jgi:hypothetical protein
VAEILSSALSNLIFLEGVGIFFVSSSVLKITVGLREGEEYFNVMLGIDVIVLEDNGFVVGVEGSREIGALPLIFDVELAEEWVEDWVAVNLIDGLVGAELTTAPFTSFDETLWLVAVVVLVDDKDVLILLLEELLPLLLPLLFLSLSRLLSFLSLWLLLRPLFECFDDLESDVVEDEDDNEEEITEQLLSELLTVKLWLGVLEEALQLPLLLELTEELPLIMWSIDEIYFAELVSEETISCFASEDFPPIFFIFFIFIFRPFSTVAWCSTAEPTVGVDWDEPEDEGKAEDDDEELPDDVVVGWLWW